MTRNTIHRHRWAVVGLTLGVAAGMLLLVCDAQAGEVPNRLKKQIRIMEKVINEVLEESPNILVHSTTPSHGIYLDGFGALFTFEASLVDGSGMLWGFGKKFDVSKVFGNWTIERDGDKTIIITSDPDSDEETLIEIEDEDGDIKKKTIEQIEQEAREKEQERYEGGKQELIDALIDYAETLTGLDNNEHVAIAAYLGEDDFFEKREISRLVIRVKMSDLRSYASDDISLESLKGRVAVEEY